MILPPPPGPHIPPSGPTTREAVPIRYAVLVFAGFPLMAFSAVMEPLRAANLLAGRRIYDWTVVANDPAPLRASNGLKVDPDHGAAAAPDADRIVVCSGGDAEVLMADRALSWIRRQLRGGASLGAVADGAFFLARAGLLDGHACTLHWTSQRTREAVAILKDLGTPLLIHQPSYNILNRWVETDGLKDALAELGVGSIAFVPLAQGILTSKYLNGIPAGSRAAQDKSLHPSVVEKALGSVRKLNEMAAAREQTLAQMALAWVLRKGGITSALIGASKPEQVVDCVGALQNLSFTAEELAHIDAISEEKDINLWAKSSDD